MAEQVTWFGVFSTPEITVSSLRVNQNKTLEIIRVENQHNYNILSVAEGAFRVFCSSNIFDLTKGDVFVTMPFENYYVLYIEENSFSDENKPIFTLIEFAPNIFDNVVGDSKYLRAFNERKKGQNCFYKANDFDKTLNPSDVFNFIKACINKNLGFIHFKSAIGTLITILDITFDKKHGDLSSTASDDYDVKVWDYILNNCLGNITASMVEKEFNISKWYLDKVTNKFYAMPFHKTINSIRMWHAKKLMKKDLNLTHVATLCGFNNYSSFYRGYTKFFGIGPKEDYLYYKKHLIYYSDWNKKEK